MPPWQAQPHDRPRPYLRLLLTPRYRWWRPLLGLLAFTALFVVMNVVIVTVYFAVSWLFDDDFAVEEAEDQLLGGSPLGLLTTNLSLAVTILAAWGAVAFVHLERPGWLSSVVRGIRWRWLLRVSLLAALVSAGFLVISLVVPVPGDDEAYEGLDPPALGTFLALFVVIALTTPLQAAGEEYGFRGYFSQALSCWLRWRWVVALISATLFALAHGQQDAWLFADRFAFGLALSWLTWRTGGLEASIALHAANNIVALLVAVLYGELQASLVASEVPWTLALIDIAFVTVYALLADRLARRKNLALLSEVAPTPRMAPAPLTR
jgi:membrane protease YdiL (CAAX protease family)